MRRWLIRSGLVVVALLLCAAAAVAWRVWRALPVVGGQTIVKGLSASVEILRDGRGVPHVRAATEAEAYAGLGYVHAQDRLWQMEFQRRVARGRLSEVIGPETIPTDRWFRTLGVSRLAAEQWQQTSGEGRRIVEAYVRGVNAAIDMQRGTRLPIEFAVLGFEPEPWRPEDCLVWAKVLSFGLDTNVRDELLRGRLAARLGLERAAALMPASTANGPLILPEGIAPAVSAVASPTLAGRRGDPVSPTLAAPLPRSDADLPFVPRVGFSNAWVVSGARSATSKPLLANDPHLPAGLPAAWYVAHLQGGPLDVIGATLPGTPGFPIGHNRRIAWGVTAVMADVQDLYVERLGSSQVVEFRGAWEPLSLEHEIIRVKGAPDEALLVRRSRHGPIVSDVLPASGTTLALRWTALDAGERLVESYRALSLASNWEAFTVAVADLRSPMLNVVYADVDGNIGYFAPGALPIRAANHDGTLPVPGWTGEFEWLGYVAPDQLPRIYNPTRGLVVTANNPVMPDDYPHRISTNWEPSYRASRLTTLLEQPGPATVERFGQMQLDVRSPEVRLLLPWLQRAHLQDEASRVALDRLRTWDGAVTAESADAAIFVAWVDEIGRRLFEDDLGPTLWKEWSAIAPWRIKALDRIVVRSDDSWCDDVRTPDGESCEQVLGAALRAALDTLGARQGGDPSHWQRGRDNVVAFGHQPLDAVLFLRPVLSRRVASGGNATTVAPVMHTGERQVIASYRQVIDLADFDRSRFVLPLGQSGQVGSRHYTDLLGAWREGASAPLPFTRAAVDAATVDRLVLTPK